MLVIYFNHWRQTKLKEKGFEIEGSANNTWKQKGGQRDIFTGTQNRFPCIIHFHGLLICILISYT